MADSRSSHITGDHRYAADYEEDEEDGHRSPRRNQPLNDVPFDASISSEHNVRGPIIMLSTVRNLKLCG
jgi:hypothetical protein